MSNREILSAVMLKWLEPLIGTLTASKLSTIPFLANAEAKIRSTGWVSQNWTIGADLAPYMTGIASSLVQPMLNEFLSSVPDDAIPSMFHSIVDTAINNGQMSILDGNVVFDIADMQRLKRLLNSNLPLNVESIKLEEDERC